MIKQTSILIIILCFISSCTKTTDNTQSINNKINNCIDQKLNDGWDTSRAESFCDNHY